MRVVRAPFTVTGLTRCVLWLGLVLAFAAGARAQSHSDLERAEASFRAGAAAYAAGDYPAAIQALEAAYGLTPLPAIAFSLAQAERREYFVARERQHLERAITLYRQYIEQVKSGGRRADALDALSQLEPLFATLAGVDPATLNREPGAQRTRLMITAATPDARIMLDGGEPAPSPLIREVTPGAHRVRVEAAGYYSNEREVTALLGELILTEVSLEERPSRLLVSAPNEAEIFIDGELKSMGGAHLSLPLRAGSHQLAVAARGRRAAYRTLVLERGKTQAVHIDLELTTQRKIARALFITGGVGFGTSIALGLLTLRAQGNAQDFLSKREHDNVSPAELDRYHDDVEQRDRMRTGAIAMLATSAGLFATGLILHQLDRPDAREIYRRAHATARLSTPAAGRGQPRVALVSPWVAPHSAGAGARFTF